MSRELAKILCDAESQVRSLLSKAIQEGHYASVAQIAEVAGWLAERRAAVEHNSQGTHAPGDDSHASAGGAASVEVGISQGPMTTALTPAKFPYFVREGDRLVKVGSSRGSADVYEHKAGRLVLDAVVGRIMELAARKKTFEIDDMGQIRLRGHDGAVPSYQVYLCIAWLKDIDLLRSMGRRRYSLLRPSSLREEVARAWARLTER